MMAGAKSFSNRSVGHGRTRSNGSHEKDASAPYLYAVVFGISFSLLYLIGKSGFFSWFVLVFDAAWLLAGGPSILPLCASFFINNELASFANIVVWCLLNRDKAGLRKLRFTDVRIDKTVIFLVCVLLALSFFQSARLGTIVNTVVSACYLGFLVVMASLLKGTFEPDELQSAALVFAVAEIIASVAIVLKAGIKPGDGHYGTLGNAHFFGLVMCIILFVLAYFRRTSGRALKFNDLLLYAAILFALYEADAKSVLGAGLVCVAAIWLIRKLGKSIEIFRDDAVVFVIIATAVLVGASLIAENDTVKSFLLSNDFPLHEFVADTFYDDSLGINKTEYFAGTVTDMLNNGHLVFGYGLGQYGSRFANLFGYTYTYRETSAINQLVSQVFSSHMIPEYAAYASKYNDQTVKAIQWYSAVMTYPFSSFMALVGETGLIGVFLLIRLVRSVKFSSISGTCLAFFFGACIFDMYFDHIQLIGLLLLVMMTMIPTAFCSEESARSQLTAGADADVSYCAAFGRRDRLMLNRVGGLMKVQRRLTLSGRAATAPCSSPGFTK